MRALVVLLLFATAAFQPARAADVMPARHTVATAAAKTLPFPRSERSQSVWASGVCWNECGAYCAAGMVGCLKRDAQGKCLQYTDRCDRYCQNQCRSEGGPLLPDLLDF